MINIIEEDIPSELCVGIYYRIDDDENKIIFDIDEIRIEFEEKLRELVGNQQYYENKYLNK